MEESTQPKSKKRKYGADSTKKEKDLHLIIIICSTKPYSEITCYSPFIKLYTFDVNSTIYGNKMLELLHYTLNPINNCCLRSGIPLSHRDLLTGFLVVADETENGIKKWNRNNDDYDEYKHIVDEWSGSKYMLLYGWTWKHIGDWEEYSGNDYYELMKLEPYFKKTHIFETHRT